MFSDLQAFVDSGAALWEGSYESLYPLPIVAMFALLARLPFEIGVILLTGLSLVLLIALFKRGALLWLFYAPILQTLAAGQLDVIGLWLLNRATPLTLALLTLKPQLWPLCAPLLADRRQTMLRPFLIWSAVIYVPCLLLRPSWPIEWLRQVFGDSRIDGGTSASFWPVWAIGAGLLVGLHFARKARCVGKARWNIIFSSYNPAWRAYDYTMFAGGNRWLIPISWLASAAMWVVQAAWPFAILGIASNLLDDVREQDNRKRETHVPHAVSNAPGIESH